MTSWSPCVTELLALHEAFRRLKYPSEELFVATYTGGQVQFVLKHADKQFTIDVASNENPEALVAEWTKAANWWNEDATEEERQAIYTGSFFLREKSNLVMAITAKDIYPP